MKVLYALAAVLLTAIAAQAQITVTGQGQITTVPDIAHVLVGVVTDGSTAADALQANNAAMKNLFKLLADFGISERDVQTTSFNVSPKYTNPRDVEHGPPQLIGYTVSNQVQVTVRKVEQTGVIVDGLVKGGANQVNGIGFGVSDAQKQKLLAEARKKAVADARARATLYAQEAGVSLGQVMQISENGVRFPEPVFYTREQMDAKGVPLAGGEQTVTADVTVVFALGGEQK